MRKLISKMKFLLYVCLVALSVTIITSANAEDKLPKGIMKLKGQDALPLSLENLDGEKWDINQARGHWVFLHFWASWCGPCREEMPAIQAIVQKFDNSGLEIVLVNTAETEDAVFEFIGAVAPDLNSLVDADGQVTELWQPRGLPATFFVDPNGKLQYLALGGRAWHEPVYLNFLRNLSAKKDHSTTP